MRVTVSSNESQSPRLLGMHCHSASISYSTASTIDADPIHTVAPQSRLEGGATLCSCNAVPLTVEFAGGRVTVVSSVVQLVPHGVTAAESELPV